MKERAADVKDISERVISVLNGKAAVMIQVMKHQLLLRMTLHLQRRYSLIRIKFYPL